MQANLCQKLLFLHQLTHNMTTDCSWNYHENYKRRTCGLVDARISASETDLPVHLSFLWNLFAAWQNLTKNWFVHVCRIQWVDFFPRLLHPFLRLHNLLQLRSNFLTVLILDFNIFLSLRRLWGRTPFQYCSFCDCWNLLQFQ